MKNFSLSTQQRQTSNRDFNRNNYKIVMQLYSACKTETKQEPRIPINDFRRQTAEKKAIKPRIDSIRIRKALLKIAAIW